MAEIKYPNSRGLDPEVYWMVSRLSIIEEHYFDSEGEARAYAASYPGFTVDDPVRKEPRT